MRRALNGDTAQSIARELVAEVGPIAAVTYMLGRAGGVLRLLLAVLWAAIR